MTPKQKLQFNLMYATLKQISKNYQTPKQLRKSCERDYGLEYEEVLEMSYENIQNEASKAIRGVKYLTEEK